MEAKTRNVAELIRKIKFFAAKCGHGSGTVAYLPAAVKKWNKKTNFYIILKVYFGESWVPIASKPYTAFVGF